MNMFEEAILMEPLGRQVGGYGRSRQNDPEMDFEHDQTFDF